MPAPSLPGFVYDEEKKRYFKIEPNHRSHSTKYTKDAIQKREQEAKAAQELEMFKSQQKSSLIQSQLSPAATDLNTKLLLRTFDPTQTFSRTRDEVVYGWSQSIEKTSTIPSESHRNFDARTFAFDPESQNIIYHGMSTFRTNPETWIFDTKPSQGFERTPLTQLPGWTYVSSIAVTQQPKGFVYVTWKPIDDLGNNMFFYSSEARRNLVVQGCGYTYPNGGKEPTYSCAVDPSGNSFAVGCRVGVYMIDMSGDLFSAYSERCHKIKSLPGGEITDAFGVGYLGPRSLISGWRSGYIKQWDTRISARFSPAWDDFQRPGSGCLNLKVLDEHRFVTVSVGDPALPLTAMRIYDVRCGRKREKHGKEWTEPLVQCPGWDCPTVSPVLPLAADGGLNLIAASVPGGKVALFNAQTGAEVPMQGKTGGVTVPHGEADCLEIVGWKGGREKGPRLLASGGGIITEWSCQEGDRMRTEDD